MSPVLATLIRHVCERAHLLDILVSLQDRFCVKERAIVGYALMSEKRDQQTTESMRETEAKGGGE